MRPRDFLGGLLALASVGSAQHQHRHPMITAGGGNLGAVDVLRARQEECQLAGDTPCAGGPAAGCCPSGAPCIVSDGIPACSELCLGNTCAVGGCCAPGLVCPTVATGFCSAGGGAFPVPSLTIPSIVPPPPPPSFSFSDITLPPIPTFSFHVPTFTPFPSYFTPTAGGGSEPSAAASTGFGSEFSTFSGGGGGGGETASNSESPTPTFTGGDESGQGTSAASATGTSSSTGGAAVVGGGSGGSGLLWGGVAGLVGIWAL
jgi:hypothetical protein